MARYRKVEVMTWSDDRFQSLSAAQPNAQTLWLYLLTGPRTTSFPGLVVARDEVMAADLRWPIEAFREAFREASGKGLAKADWKAGLVVLRKALIDSTGEPRDTARPESPNVIKHWAKSWDEVPDCLLKAEYLRSLESFTKALGEAFHKAFQEGFRKALAKASTHPSLNQYQEQKQEQKESDAEPSLGLSLLMDTVDTKTAEKSNATSVTTMAEVAAAEINRLRGSRYEATSEAILVDCKALVKAKRTPDQVKAVIAFKAKEWIGDPKMEKQFKPSVLLRPSNFAKYLDDLEAGPGLFAQGTHTMRIPSPDDDEPDLTYAGFGVSL